jgi:cytoskeletal protein CcmA (bactofilin family)
VALQEEASVLADVLRERADVSVTRRPSRARARGLAIGIVPVLGLAALLAAVGGWLLEQRLPPGMGWINPLGLFGVYEMFIDLVFLLRDTAPVLFDLGIAVGATAGMAAVCTFLLNALFRRFTGPAVLGLVTLAIVSSLPSSSSALDLRWHVDSVSVAASETLEDTLVVSAEVVDIDGDLKGDLVALAERINIRGTVEGNVFAIAREVVVSGKVDGSLHLACEICTLEGEVTGSLYGGAETLAVRSSGTVGRDVVLFGESVRMDGKAGRDLFMGAERAELRGEVGRNATTRSEHLNVSAGASVARNLDVQTPDEEDAIIAVGARVGGETRQAVLEHPMPEHRTRWASGGFYLRLMVFLGSAFLVGMLLHTLFPNLFAAQLETSTDFLRCLGFGFIALIAVPVLLILCFVTVVGIPIGLIGTFVYLTTLFVSLTVVAALVGSAITGADPTSAHGFGTALLLGLVIVGVAVNLPFVGGLLRLLVGLTGMGLLIVAVRDSWRRQRVGYA